MLGVACHESSPVQIQRLLPDTLNGRDLGAGHSEKFVLGSHFVLVHQKRAWLEAALEEGIPIREPDDLESYSGQFKLRLPRSLHKSLTEHARREGISMNQYCVYLLSKNDAAAAR